MIKDETSILDDTLSSNLNIKRRKKSIFSCFFSMEKSIEAGERQLNSVMVVKNNIVVGEEEFFNRNNQRRHRTIVSIS